MESRSLEYVARACQGRLLAGAPEARVSGVSTDSRRVTAGDLFFAILGERFDGHDYLAEASRKGAAAAVVARARVGDASQLSPALGIVVVEDTRVALGRLGGSYRADFSLPIVAISGSNGKTTTKELLASVLRQNCRTLWSEASFNNDLGVPLTLLKLERQHEVAVLEVGTNHPGELLPLLRLIQPRLGVLTNIGREHLEFFGDLEGVAGEEGSLAECLPPSGKLFLHGDDAWTPALMRRAKADVVRVGFGAQNHWRAGQVAVAEDGVTFAVSAPRVTFSGEYRIRLLGRHQVPNALLALAAGTELGVSPEQARRGLAECAPPKMRLQIWETHGVRILDDAYNANADSMLAALRTLHDLPCAGRRVAVLGDMAELGPHSAEAHSEIGRRAAELGISRLVAIGKWSQQMAQAARDAGLTDAREFADVSSAAAAMRRLVEAGDLVLLKASRATGLEKVGEALRGGSGSDGG